MNVQDVLDFMHKRLLKQAEVRKLVQQDKVAAAAEVGVDFGKPPAEAAASAAAAVDEAAAQQQQQLEVMEKVRQVKELCCERADMITAVRGGGRLKGLRAEVGIGVT